MAPLTRNRAGTGLIPGPFAAEYYAQRASAGLVIAEPLRFLPRRKATPTRRAAILTTKSEDGKR